MAESASPKIKIGAVELPEALIRRIAQSRQSTNTVLTPAPTENAIFQIIFSEGTPEAKRIELAKFMTFPGTKEEAKARVKAYQEFEEYLQSERERMSREIIKLTDTETFSELQAVYNDLNNALIEFDDKMRPLTEIIDAIYVLRTNNQTMAAFTEIQSDRKSEAARAEQKAQQEAEFESVHNRIGFLNTSIAQLGEQRSFWGMGGVKQEARAQIAANEVALNEAQINLEALATEIAKLDAPPVQSNMGEFVEQKGKLRELLDISSDEHKQRQRDLVDAALGFVEKAKTRIGAVRNHLGRMTDQIDSLYDANTKMTGVYAVMSEGIKDATAENRTIRESLQTPAPDVEESMIAKMGREEKLGAVEDHMRACDTASGSTIETFSDLTSQTIRIRTMRDSNEAQSDKARRMHNQGVAGVADRLSVVLNAVSAAALGESSAMAKGTLEGMVERTNKVAQKEVIQLALGVHEMNRDIEKAIGDLGDFGEVLRTSTGIWREGLTEVHQNIDRMRELAEEVRGDIKDSIGVHADVSVGSTPGPKDTGVKTPSPFAFGKAS